VRKLSHRAAHLHAVDLRDVPVDRHHTRPGGFDEPQRLAGGVHGVPREIPRGESIDVGNPGSDDESGLRLRRGSQVGTAG